MSLTSHGLDDPELETGTPENLNRYLGTRGAVKDIPRLLGTFCVYFATFRLHRNLHNTNVIVDEIADERRRKCL